MNSSRQCWKKLGRICDGSHDWDWASTHAALPVVDATAGGARVFFTARDDRGRSSIGVADLRLDGATALPIARASRALAPGPLGAFDDSGVTSSCLVRFEGRSYLYYTGWSLGVTVPFYLYVGLAVSENGIEFSRVSPAPILERSAVDPFLTASPWVIVENGVWRMWYVSAANWTIENGKAKHYYHIRYAESADGVKWRREGTVCIDFANRDEYAFGRPCVIKERDGLYLMWYSYRGERYRIGFAESLDGITWRRRDSAAGIEPAREGWDADMLTYPAVFDLRGNRYMLYNGNGYGRTGMGLAVLE